MRKLTIALTLTVLSFAATSGAQQACPCVPISHLWVVQACDSWNCAASAVVLANGKDVVPLPTTSFDFPWVVLQRVTSGSAGSSSGAFVVDGFDSISDGVARYAAIDRDLQPILMTAPDGKVLVIARTEPEKPRKRVANP